MGLDEPAKLAELSLDDLKAVLDPQLEGGPIAIGLVGDFDEQAAIAAVGATLGALPAREPRVDGAHEAEASFAADRQVRVLRHSGAADQGVVSLSWPTTDDADLRSMTVRNLLASVLQLRLLDEIREKLGATYTPNAFSSASDTFRGFGHLTTLAPAEPGQMDLVAETMKTLAAGLAASPPSEDELLRARGPIVEQLQRQERTNAGWTNIVAEAQSYPGILDRRRQRMETLQSITAQELQAAAKQWFAAEPLEIRVLPEE
jgi:zinc protease